MSRAHAVPLALRVHLVLDSGRDYSNSCCIYIPHMTPSQSFDVGSATLAAQLFGQQNQNLKLIEKKLGIRLGSQGTVLQLSGNPAQVQVGYRLLEELCALLRDDMPLYPTDIDYAIRILSIDSSTNLRDIFYDTVFVSARNKLITPKSLAQKSYIDQIRSKTLVFGIGPAGTGKTYLAMAMGVAALMRKEVSRIMLVRPAVEAGEKLGFLPGDLAEKVNPYLRPLYDALYEMLGFDYVTKLIEKSVIEIAPLAFMRGRTLNNAFIILDESQNTTREQMKMFLTRIGFGSTAVITGDTTQVDLPRGQNSGLIHAASVLSKVSGIGFTRFESRDVVRHPLVQRIVEAYDVFDGGES